MGNIQVDPDVILEAKKLIESMIQTMESMQKDLDKAVSSLHWESETKKKFTDQWKTSFDLFDEILGQKRSMNAGLQQLADGISTADQVSFKNAAANTHSHGGLSGVSHSSHQTSGGFSSAGMTGGSLLPPSFSDTLTPPAHFTMGESLNTSPMNAHYGGPTSASQPLRNPMDSVMLSNPRVNEHDDNKEKWEKMRIDLTQQAD